jgi:hypothetical protein
VPLTLRGVPGLGADTSALAAASFLNFARHPQMRMMLLMPVLLAMLILVMTRIGRDQLLDGQATALPMFLLFWPFFNFSTVLFNQFGMDAGGFRALVLLPIPRHRVFLARNLALAPFVLGLGVLLAVVGAKVLSLPPHRVAFILIHQAALFFLMCTAGNLLSLWLPYHIRYDAGSRPSSRGQNALTGLVGMLITLVLMLPATGCVVLGAAYGPAAGLAASAALLTVAAAIYVPMLTFAGDQFMARELAVLDRLVRTRETGG